jgi:tetratricopeptide (TPR) repeat protein
MADGGEPRRRRKRSRAASAIPRTPDALDIALERVDDDDAANALLKKHTELLEAQIRTERLDHGAKRMAMAARFLIAFAALAIASGFIWMVLAASADRSLVIEAFATPPDLAARGLSGQVLAANLADRLGEIDRAANSFRSPETMSTNWGDDVKIEIPSTGISIGELDRFLRRKLGRETVIGGSVFRTPQGLRMTVRTGVLGTVEQTGSDAQIEDMIRKAAEGVFNQTQPYRYSKYLEFSGRLPEAMAVARSDAQSDDPKERAWAWAQISNLLDRVGNDVASAAAGKRAIAEDPSNALAYLNTANAYGHLAQNGLAAPYGAEASRLGSTPSGGLSDVGINTSRSNLAAGPAFAGDFQRALRQLSEETGPVYAGVRESNQGVRVLNLLAMHDISGARAAGTTMPDSYFISNFTQGSGVTVPQHLAADQMENWPLALKLDDQMLATVATNPEGKAVADIVRTRFILPIQAADLAYAGRIEEAQAIAKTLPLNCDNCAEVRMMIAAFARDYPAAYRWLAEARRWGGDTPFQPTLLGQILENQGQHAAALQLAEQAIRVGPKYPDALKLKADALRRLNRLDEAVESYRAAAKGAPRWGRLQIDWGFAEMRRGHWADARKHLASAGTMDLTPSDQRLLLKLKPIAWGRGTAS